MLHVSVCICVDVCGCMYVHMSVCIHVLMPTLGTFHLDSYDRCLTDLRLTNSARLPYPQNYRCAPLHLFYHMGARN